MDNRKKRQRSDHRVRNRFLDCLLASFQSFNSGASSSTVLVTTMRAGFLANALSYRPLADMLQNADIKLGAMSREELTEVILKPAEELGVKFDEGLVERILNDVEDESVNLPLPLLEFALTQLWKHRQGKQLTHAAYQHIGKVQGALVRHAEKFYKNLDVIDQKQVQRIFLQLVRPGEGTKDTRRLATKAEFGENSWSLVQRLANDKTRLVVINRTANGRETVEVVHHTDREQIEINESAAENVYVDTNPLADIQEQQLASIDIAAQYSAAQNLTAFNYLTVDYMKHRDFSVQELAEEVHKSEQAVRKTFDSMMENPASATKKLRARISRRRSSQRVMA